jgi:hypothetical protein
LGFKGAKLYKPGWLGYPRALSAPAADETFVNMGALNHHIRSLEARIDELEKKIAEVKKQKYLPRGGTSLFFAHNEPTMDGRPWRLCSRPM